MKVRRLITIHLSCMVEIILATSTPMIVRTEILTAKPEPGVFSLSRDRDMSWGDFLYSFETNTYFDFLMVAISVIECM
jgi:hypothetical protein